MEIEDIISGSKLIAKYMGLVYIPYSTEMKHSKGGYYEVRDATPKIEEFTQTSYIVGDESNATVNTVEMDINKIRYSNKNGWELIDGFYYKYVCRTHGDLRYWNSLNDLVPVIQKIDKEEQAVFELKQNGCTILKWGLKLKGGNSSYSLPNWSNNVFVVIVSFLRENENK